MINKKIIILIILLVISLILAVDFTFFNKKRCENYSCFEEAMKKCDKVIFYNDAEEATWRYEIKEIKDNECVVNVKLLQVKKGDIGLEKLNGLSMDCSYLKGISNYPEKNLEKCHGRLKEELQIAIIKKLYNYIIDNVEKIGDNLETYGAQLSPEED